MSPRVLSTFGKKLAYVLGLRQGQCPYYTRQFIGAAVALTMTGCSLFGGGKPEPVFVRQHIYPAAYDEVERAMKQAMIRYPQKIDNPDAGIYETDWIRGDLRFKPAHFHQQAQSEGANYRQQMFSEGYRYRLIVRLVRGKFEDKSAIKVTISKQSVLQRDFFAPEETMGSDGLEEMMILYRIQRELVLEKAIKRAQEKTTKASTAEESKTPTEETPATNN